MRQDTLLCAQGHENGAAPTTEVLLLEGAQQEFVFTEVPEQPVPSLLRGFSAPVKLEVRGLFWGQPMDKSSALHSSDRLIIFGVLHGCNHADNAQRKEQLRSCRCTPALFPS